MKVTIGVLTALPLLGGMWPGFAQTPDRPPANQVVARQQDAYFQFLLGRHLDDQDDIEGAIAAYRRAAELDPAAADIMSELAELYGRQNRALEARRAAEAALALEPGNVQGNWVLGSLYSALAEGSIDAEALGLSAPLSPDDAVARAIDHLERARRDRAVNSGLDFRLGQLYLAKGEYQKAVQSLARFADQEALTSDVGLLLARAYLGAGQSEQAIETLKIVLEHDSTSGRAMRFLAQLYEEDGRWAEAAALYKDALERRPTSRELRTQRATALVNAGETTEARDLLRQLDAEGRPDPQVLYLLSQSELYANDFDAAEGAARRLTALDASDIRGPYALAQIYERRHEPSKVIETLGPVVDRVQGIAPRQLAALLTRLGFAYLELEQNDRALAAFQRARTAAPPEAALEASVIRAYLADRRFAQALEHVREARQTFPLDPSLLQLEARALQQSGQPERAVALLKDALKDRAEEPAVHVALASIYAEARRFAEATEVLEQASAAFPDDTAVLYELGAALDREKKHVEAELAFRKVLTEDPKHAPALNYLGYMLADRGERLEESLGLIRRALEVDPMNAAYLDSLGWAYFKLNRLDLAESPLGRAAARLATNSVVQDHYGDLLFRLGRFGDAAAAWQRALDGDGASIDRAAVERKLRSARDRAGLPSRKQ